MLCGFAVPLHPAVMHIGLFSFLCSFLEATVKPSFIGLNTPEECLARIKNRVSRGGHDVSEADLRREFASRWDAVERILPYCDEAHFFDNDNGFVEVAEYRNGEVVSIGELRPDWLKELQGYLGNANAIGEYYE